MRFLVSVLQKDGNESMGWVMSACWPLDAYYLCHSAQSSLYITVLGDTLTLAQKVQKLTYLCQGAAKERA